MTTYKLLSLSTHIPLIERSFVYDNHDDENDSDPSQPIFIPTIKWDTLHLKKAHQPLWETFFTARGNNDDVAEIQKRILVSLCAGVDSFDQFLNLPPQKIMQVLDVFYKTCLDIFNATTWVSLNGKEASKADLNELKEKVGRLKIDEGLKSKSLSKTRTQSAESAFLLPVHAKGKVYGVPIVIESLKEKEKRYGNEVDLSHENAKQTVTFLGMDLRFQPSGSFGTVLLAENRAFKTILIDATDVFLTQIRILREAENFTKLSGEPCNVFFYKAGDQWIGVIDMPQCVPAMSKKHTTVVGATRLYQAAKYMRGIHEKGVVHRDLKPENLMVLNGHIVSIDTDTVIEPNSPRAALAQVMPFGTFVSPKQLESSPGSDVVVTPKEDKFAFVTLLFEWGGFPALYDRFAEIFSVQSELGSGTLYSSWSSGSFGITNSKDHKAFNKKVKQFLEAIQKEIVQAKTIQTRLILSLAKLLIETSGDISYSTITDMLEFSASFKKPLPFTAMSRSIIDYVESTRNMGNFLPLSAVFVAASEESLPLNTNVKAAIDLVLDSHNLTISQDNLTSFFKGVMASKKVLHKDTLLYFLKALDSWKSSDPAYSHISPQKMQTILESLEERRPSKYAFWNYDQGHYKEFLDTQSFEFGLHRVFNCAAKLTYWEGLTSTRGSLWDLSHDRFTGPFSARTASGKQFYLDLQSIKDHYDYFLRCTSKIADGDALRFSLHAPAPIPVY